MNPGDQPGPLRWWKRDASQSGHSGGKPENNHGRKGRKTDGIGSINHHDSLVEKQPKS